MYLVLLFCSCFVRQALSGKYLLELEEDGESIAEAPQEPDEHGSDYGANWNDGGGSNWRGRNSGGGHAPAPAPAPVHCSWGQFGSWSGGNQACGPGTRTRSRSCRCTDGSSGRCGGGSATQSETVNKQACSGGGG